MVEHIPNKTNMKKLVTLETRDGVKVKVPMAITNMCKLLNDAFEGNEGEEDEEALTTPVQRVDKEQLDLIIKYCEHHKYAKSKSDLPIPLP